jgi:hypothetical protein
MSRFNDENTAQLARHAFKLRVDDPEEKQRKAKEAAPLRGKEAQLLAALREAEQVYEEWLELEPRRDQLRRSISTLPTDCEKLAKHLQSALACWSKMSEDNRYELAARSPNRGTVEEVTRRFDSTLTEMLSCAQRGSTEVNFSWRGRPRKSRAGMSLVALEEFTKVVRAFWVEEVSPVFGFDQTTIIDETTDANKGRREPASAATRLIEGAAKILDPRYNLSNVRQVMESVYHDPQPY